MDRPVKRGQPIKAKDLNQASGNLDHITRRGGGRGIGTGQAGTLPAITSTRPVKFWGLLSAGHKGVYYRADEVVWTSRTMAEVLPGGISIPDNVTERNWQIGLEGKVALIEQVDEQWVFSFSRRQLTVACGLCQIPGRALTVTWTDLLGTPRTTTLNFYPNVIYPFPSNNTTNRPNFHLGPTIWGSAVFTIPTNLFGGTAPFRFLLGCTWQPLGTGPFLCATQYYDVDPRFPVIPPTFPPDGYDDPIRPLGGFNIFNCSPFLLHFSGVNATFPNGWVIYPWNGSAITGGSGTTQYVFTDLTVF